MTESLQMLPWFAAYAFGILCVAKLLLCPFSKRVRASVRRYPLLHALGAVIAITPSFASCFQNSRPPVLAERNHQRQAVNSIVQTNGGWDAFRSEAVRLLELARTNEQQEWYPRFANSSPRDRLPEGFPLFAALNPQEVGVRPYTFQSHEQALFVKVYGLHSTGGRGIPFYGLLYAPAPLNSPKEPVGLEALARSQIVPSVYELYPER